MEKFVQNVKDKIITPECVSQSREVYTQCRKTLMTDTFFIKMVSHDEENTVQPAKINNSGQAVDTVTDDKMSLLVNGSIVTFKIDTGAKANLINENDFNALTEKPRRSSGKVIPLKASNNQLIKTKGGCNLKVTAKGKQHNLSFTIVPNGHESLLGEKASEALFALDHLQLFLGIIS